MSKEENKLMSAIIRIVALLFFIGMFVLDKFLGEIQPPLEYYWYLIALLILLGVDVKEIAEKLSIHFIKKFVDKDYKK